MTEVVILGAGPAGLAAALELAEAGVKVTVIEQQEMVGGNAASFTHNGIHLDYGSHRLHPASDPQVLARIRGLLGDDLLTRPRHGRIRLMGRWIHFPLRPVDLLLRCNPKFSFGVALDLVKKVLPSPTVNGEETFASVLQSGLGNTICNEFYFPYAKKIWGLAPEELSPIQARKRVSAGSIGKMIKRLLPGGAGSGAANTKGVFYYPRQGFGQICQALAEAAVKAGADLRLNTTITGIKLSGERPAVVVENEDGVEELVADQLYSTIPVTVFTRLLDIETPAAVKTAIDSLQFRSMLLVYLQLETGQFTEYDAHYFPGSELPFTRLSETKNYYDSTEPQGRTILCAEVPCFRDDDVWTMSNEALGEMVKAGLEKAGLPIRCEVTEVISRRLPFAYPLYRNHYENHYSVLDQWVESLDRVLSFGRQGLYAHDNTHHAMFMAKSAADCLQADGTIDKQAWLAARKIFEGHVVED